MIECPRSFCLVKLKVNVCEVAPGPVSMMLCYVIVNNATSTDHLRMLRTDCSGKTRLALHVPSSLELESVIIIIIIIIIIIMSFVTVASTFKFAQNAQMPHQASVVVLPSNVVCTLSFNGLLVNQTRLSTNLLELYVDSHCKVFWNSFMLVVQVIIQLRKFAQAAKRIKAAVGTEASAPKLVKAVTKGDIKPGDLSDIIGTEIRDGMDTSAFGESIPETYTEYSSLIELGMC